MKKISIATLRTALAPVGLTLNQITASTWDITHAASGMASGPITGKKRIAACVAHVLASGETFSSYQRPLAMVHEWRTANPR